MRRFKKKVYWEGPELQTVLEYIEMQHLKEIGYTFDPADLDAYTAKKFVIISQEMNAEEKKPSAGK